MPIIVRISKYEFHLPVHEHSLHSLWLFSGKLLIPSIHKQPPTRPSKTAPNGAVPAGMLRHLVATSLGLQVEQQVITGKLSLLGHFSRFACSHKCAPFCVSEKYVHLWRSYRDLSVGRPSTEPKSQTQAHAQSPFPIRHSCPYRRRWRRWKSAGGGGGRGGGMRRRSRKRIKEYYYERKAVFEPMPKQVL